MSTQDTRAKLIRAIQTGRRTLGLTDEEYQALMGGATGKTSCTECSEADLVRALRALRRAGFDVPDSPEIRKARALWLTLKDYGELRNASEHAFQAYLHKMTKGSPDKMWCAIEGLKKMVHRAKIKAALADSLETEDLAHA